MIKAPFKACCLTLPLEYLRDKHVQPDGELSDSEDEGEGGRKHRKDRKHPDEPPRPLVPASEVAGSMNGKETTEEASQDTTTQEEPSTETNSPSAAIPGLSMNAFGRPTMTAPAAVAEDEDMDVDEPLIPGRSGDTMLEE